jgi:thiamine-phosphate pyrophosphorylase
MKSFYVTDRSAIGDDRFGRVLERLAGAPELSVELRETEGSDRERLALACEAKRRLGPSVPLYIHRRFDVALAAGAAGVHLPANGLPLSCARTHTPRGFRVGVSTHSPREAEEAISAGADLVVIGPIFDTPSKRAFGPPLGPESLAALPRADSHRSEVYAIGGMAEQRLPELDPYRDRISGVAAIRLFQESEDPRAVVERIAVR